MVSAIYGAKRLTVETLTTRGDITLAGDIIPDTDDTRSLGASGKDFTKIWNNDADAFNVAPTPAAHEGTHVSGGADDLDSALAAAAMASEALEKEMTGGVSAALATNGTDEYFPVSGVDTKTSTAEYRLTILPKNITITQMNVRLTTAPGSGNSRTFNLRVNGSNHGTITVTISNTDTTGEWTGSVALSKGDRIENRSDGGVSIPAASRAQISYIYKDT